MKISWIFIVLLFALRAEGQNRYRHEIGVGASYLEYNPYRDGFYFERWHNSLPLKSNSVDHYLIYFNQKYNKRTSYPVIYYTYHFCKK